MKVLITGAAGFIGANLCHRLKGEDIYFHGVDNLSFGNKDNLPEGMDFHMQDFAEVHEDFLNCFDVLIHLATSNIIYAMGMPQETYHNNAVKTAQLFTKFNGRIIYTSTASVYGNAKNIPTKETDAIQLSNAYDTSKYIAELFLQQRGNFTTLRLSNVYGRFQDATNPYCGVLGKFVDQYLHGNPFTIYGNGDHTRDYTYVDDVVDAIILAAHQKPHNTEINIATGKETSALFIAEKISLENEVKKMPVRKIDGITRRCLDIKKAKQLLGWQPQISIAEGIERTIKEKKLTL